MASSDDRTVEAVRRAQAYLRGRQCRDGGFSFYRSEYLEEPNLVDTHAAVTALARLGSGPPDRPAAIRYLRDATVFGVRYLFCCAFALDALGVALENRLRTSIAALAPRPPDLATSAGPTEWLDETWRVALLRRRFADPLKSKAIADTLLALEAADGGFGSVPNLLDTHLALETLAAVDAVPQGARIRDFIAGLEAPRAGFVLARGSGATDLDVVYAGVRSCRILGMAPKYPLGIRNFVLDCQVRDGAFARGPVALPDIELTARALEIVAGPASGRVHGDDA